MKFASGYGAHSNMKTLMMILNEVLADEKTTLAAAGCDIERVAACCQENYLKNQQDGKLEHTMAFATQSLGTVAYYINKLCNHFIEALDIQSQMLGDVSDRIDKLRMMSDIQREKVSRKAIGSCTVTKTPVVYQKHNTHTGHVSQYVRRPIDYNILDHIGHGVHLQDATTNNPGAPSMNSGTVVRRTSTSASVQNMFSRQHSTMSCRTVGPKTTLEYAEPMHSTATLRYNMGGTLGRTAGIYRTAMVPAQHISNYAGPSASLHYQHASANDTSSNTGSITSSNYAAGFGHFVTTATGAQPDWNQPAHMLMDPSRRSSGSSSGGSNLQHAFLSQYANNNQQQVHQVQGQQPNVAALSSQVPGPRQQQQQFSYGPQPLNAAQLLNTGQQMTQAEYMARQHYAQQLAMQQANATEQSQQASSPMLSNATSVLPVDPKLLDARQAPLVGHPQYMGSSKQATATTPTAIAGCMENAPIPPPPPEAYAGSVAPEQSQNYFFPNPPQQHFEQSRAEDEPTRLIARKPSDPAWAPDYYMEKVITVYDYVQDKDDELSFTENQVIYVTKKNDDGWWEGVMNGTTGLFPGNYVELLE